jgi:hypothetical protein
MVIIKSKKLETEQRQYKIVAENYVLLRILIENDKTYKVMTATAGEYDHSFSAYPHQAQLMEAAVKAFSPICDDWKDKHDHKNRDYAEFCRVDDPCEIIKAGTRITAALGLDIATCSWIDAEARQEGRESYEEFNADGEERAYLGDGVYVTKDGKYIDEK